jgi:DNA-binding MarR family transcriptional regulator
MYTSDLPTYLAVVMQSRAHRALKASLTAALRPYGITMMQWSLIGLIADQGSEGVRISDLARSLDTSLAFVTTTINALQAKDIVTRTGHTRDNRAKLVSLSPEFAGKVTAIEADIKKALLANLYDGVAGNDLATYFKVVQHIARSV